MSESNIGPELNAPQTDVLYILFEESYRHGLTSSLEEFREVIGEDVIRVANLFANTPNPLTEEEAATRLGMKFEEYCTAADKLRGYMPSRSLEWHTTVDHEKKDFLIRIANKLSLEISS